jgi:glucitol operon activator protein
MKMHMDPTTQLILIAIIAWVLQILLGYFQVRAFNSHLRQVAEHGAIKIGRTQSRWKARTVVLMALNEENIIQDARIMKGLSVFSRPKKLDKLIGLQAPLPSTVLASFDKPLQEALNVAFE